MKNHRGKLAGILLVIACLALVHISFVKSKKLKEQISLYEVSQQELVTYKDKNGDLVSKIQIMETTSTKMFLDLKTKDSTILSLQQLVKDNKKLLKKRGSAVVIKTETKVEEVVKTEIVEVPGDLPIYKSEKNTPWYNIKSTSTKDSTSYSFKVFSDLQLVLGEERQGLFKPKKFYGIIKDKNPYTNIKDMKVYTVSPSKPKRFGVGPYIGYGVNFNSNSLQTTWQIGLGIQYNLIRF